MDVVVSSHAWLPKAGMSEADVFLLKKRLTIIPPENAWGPGDEEEEPKIINMWRESETHIGVPRAYFMEHKTSKHNVVLRLPNPVPAMAQLVPQGKLRIEDQEPVAKVVLDLFRSKPFHGGIVCAYTGYGKTSLAIETARRFGLRTLILVHKNPLKEQWIERIKSWVPDAKIGTIQSASCDFEGKDFVIGMIQSMMQESGDKYPRELWNAFGLVIADEVHRCGAAAFSTVAPKFNAPYFLGLSATPKRKDGCDNAFKWVIGEVIATPTDKNRTQPIIYLRNTGVRAEYSFVNRTTGETVHIDLNDFKKPTVLKRIAKNRFRNGIIIQDVLKALKAGRSPLIMAERLDILHCIAEGAQKLAPSYLGREITAGMYIGGKKRSELDVAAQSDIVLATIQLAKEGIDIQRLDTLFMASPVGDPVQIIGRIGRSHTINTPSGTQVIPPKHQPMVVDYIDYDLKALKATFFSRIKYYKKFGWQTMGMKI